MIKVFSSTAAILIAQTPLSFAQKNTQKRQRNEERKMQISRNWIEMIILKLGIYRHHFGDMAIWFVHTRECLKNVF